MLCAATGVQAMISATGVVEGQAFRSTATFIPDVQLTAPLVVEGAPLVIGVATSSAAGSQSIQITVPVGASTAASTLALLAGNGGSCTWTYVSGDARFAGWSKAVSYTGVTMVLSGAPAGGRVLAGSTFPLTITIAPYSVVFDADVVCLSGSSATGLLDPNYVSLNGQGQTVATVQYTTPVSARDITCTLTARQSSDSDFAGKTNTLAFSTAPAPSLSVSGIAPAAVLLTGSTHTLTLTAVPAVANGALTVTSSCTTVPATFVIENGASTAEVVYTAPDSSSNAVTCTFALAAGGDPYFAGITNVGSVTFSVDVPLAITADAAPVLATGRTQPISLSFSRVVAAGGLELTATCSAGSVPSPFTVGTASMTHVVQYTAAATDAQGVTCTFARVSGDDRYTGLTATLTRDVVTVGLSVSGPAAGAELIGELASEFNVTASHAVFGSPLIVTPICMDGTSSVGSFEPVQLSIDAGATSATAVYTAPAASVASLVCSFSYASGDERFAQLSPSVTFSVLKPVLAFSGVAQGATLLTGSQSNLTVTANAPIAGELRLAVLCMAAGSAVLSATVVVPAGETSGFVPFTAPLLAAGSAECKVSPQSGDARFNDQAVTDAVPVIVFSVALPTVTLSGLTEGAQVQAGSTQRIAFTVSDTIIVDDLTVNVTCPGVGVSGYFRIDVNTERSTETRIVVPANATVGATYTCTFQYLRGDERYTNAAMPAPLSFSVAAVPVVDESSSSTGNAGGEPASSSSTGGTTGGTTGTGADDSGMFSSTSTDGPCTDSECGAVAQAASGLASLALIVALAAAHGF